MERDFGYHKNLDEKKQDLSKSHGFAVDDDTVPLVKVPAKTGNHFIDAIHHAFARETALELSPDMIWNIILQGVAIHVSQNAEHFREKMSPGSAEGEKKELVVIANYLRMGNKDNDWPRVLEEFKDQISDMTKAAELVDTARFTTTTPITVTAARVALCDMMSSYVNFTVITRCGITDIYLRGTPEDWKQLKAKVWELLSFFELADWYADMLPSLDAFCEPEKDYWKSLYKFESRSGSEDVSGWITRFFPYSQSPRGFIKRYPSEPSQFPSSVATLPFTWKYFDTVIPGCKITAGVIGVAYRKETECVIPMIGYEAHVPEK
jgi:hypothetical protein